MQFAKINVSLESGSEKETEIDATSKEPRSTLVSRNVTISGHRTSVRLEPDMWSGLSEICRREGSSLHDVCSAVANRKGDNTSLTAAIRVFVMAYYRAAATEEGHTRTGHGYGLTSLLAKMPAVAQVGSTSLPKKSDVASNEVAESPPAIRRLNG